MSNNMQKIGAEGGYDLSELEAAKEAFNNEYSDGQSVQEFQDVEPILIQISDEEVVETKEYEARAVIIEYDAYGEPVSVELL